MARAAVSKSSKVRLRGAGVWAMTAEVATSILRVAPHSGQATSRVEGCFGLIAEPSGAAGNACGHEPILIRFGVGSIRVNRGHYPEMATLRETDFSYSVHFGCERPDQPHSRF